MKQGCDYCYSAKNLITDYSHRVFIQGKEMRLQEHNEDARIWDDWIEKDVIKINYCPMCGRPVGSADKHGEGGGLA